MLYLLCFICHALSAMLYFLCFIYYALSTMLSPLCFSPMLYQLCFICNALSAILFICYALTAMLYPLYFICYALSAIFYLICFIRYALSTMLYHLCSLPYCNIQCKEYKGICQSAFDHCTQPIYITINVYFEKKGDIYFLPSAYKVNLRSIVFIIEAGELIKIRYNFHNALREFWVEAIYSVGR